IHSRFAGARVLLTLRDSSGIRLWKTFTLPREAGVSAPGVLELNEPLPADLRYGCSVDVQYVDQEDLVHLASKLIHVKPDDRILTVETKMKEVCTPGEKVKI